MYCTSQIRVTLLAGAETSHTGKQSLRGLKQTFPNQHGTGDGFLGPTLILQQNISRCLLSRKLTYPTWGKGKSSSKVPGWGYVSFQGHKAYI